MSELQSIHETVRRAAIRLRLERAWRAGWVGLAAAAGLWLATLALYKTFPVPDSTLFAAGIGCAVVVLAAALWGWSRRVTDADAARWLDQRQQLRERLSTALEMATAPSRSEWHDLVVADAAAHAGKIDLRSLLPWRLPRPCRWALLLLLLGAGLGFVPEYRNPRAVQAREDARNIQNVGRQMAQLVRRTINQRQPALETTLASLDTVAQLGDHLAQTKLTRGEALKDLASATDKLRQDSRELTRNPAIRKLEAAARTSTRSPSSQSADLQKQIEELSKALGDKAAKPDAVDQLRKDLEDMRQAGQSMADKDATASDAAREQLAQSIAELARKAESMGIPLDSLDEAIAALASNKIDQFLRDLNTADNELERLQSMAQTLQQLQQQSAKIGKDLAEQLKNGQAQAAQASLQRMISQLDKASLSPEALQKILAEVADAVKPAGEYGKVSEFLKDGAQKLAQGDKSGGSKALADAAKELQTLLEQLGDAQSLMASLDALKRAQMAIGNGQSWALADGLPAAGQGGGLGRGVGTWADDSQIMDITDIKDAWDNSGVERPDSDPRGVSDRGEGSLADSLVPTRVKGQMSQGGPMPSITLRGVSIRGQSSVAYQEAIMSAQSDAQSALSQDQVPRAYQGAVKNYFDDLK